MKWYKYTLDGEKWRNIWGRLMTFNSTKLLKCWGNCYQIRHCSVTNMFYSKKKEKKKRKSYTVIQLSLLDQALKSSNFLVRMMLWLWPTTEKDLVTILQSLIQNSFLTFWIIWLVYCDYTLYPLLLISYLIFLEGVSIFA